MKRLFVILLTLLMVNSSFSGKTVEYASFNVPFPINNVNSSILRSLVVSPIAAGVAHVAGGTTANLIEGQNLGDAFTNSFKGVEKSMAIGLGVGVATTVGVSYANGINPLTGEAINSTTITNNNSVRTEPANLSEQIALKAAQNGQGVEIMQGKINDPAWQGWQKIQYIHNNPDGSRIVIHYWRNPQTGTITGFKFK